MRTGTAISPNQDSKRRQIIEAARVVLARGGLSGCTARAVAEASPLTKSAINYYFASMDEIIDLAMAAHVEAMLGEVVVDRAFGQRAGVGDRPGGAAGQPVAGQHGPRRLDDLAPLAVLVR